MEQNEENNSNCVTGIACVDINDNYMANSLTSNTFTRQQQLINKQANSNRKLFKNTSCSNIDHRKENIKRTTDDNDQFTVQLGQNLDVPINNVADEDDHDDNNNIMEVHDDRQGCRSLVCNFNGIIVAEMIYRCMVCANMADSMAEAHKHYQLKHIDNSCGMSMNTAKSLQRHKEIANISNNTSCSIINSNQPVNLTTNSNRAAKFDSNNINSMTTINSTNGNNSSDLEDYSFSSQEMPLLNFDTPNHFGYEDIDSSFFPSLITPSPASSQTKKARSEALVNNTNNSNKSTGNLIVGSGGGGSSSRGGYVTCEVCHITKFYASVQRRYGKFTCMGCAKFFGRFLMKPRRYYCPDLGTCTLDQTPRCKACLLLACMNTYVIDEKRMKVVDANRPMKRMCPGPASPSFCAITTSTSSPNESNPIEARDSPAKLIPTPICDRESELTSISESTSQVEQNSNINAKSSIKDDKVNLTTVMKEKASNRVSSTNIRTPKRNNDGVSQKNSNSSNPGRKVAGCRACTGCLADDCGKCHYCLDKPKFGGGNTLKKKCVTKRCLVISHKMKSSNVMRKN